MPWKTKIAKKKYDKIRYVKLMSYSTTFAYPKKQVKCLSCLLIFLGATNIRICPDCHRIDNDYRRLNKTNYNT